MHVLIFGATGMIGHGALEACLRDPAVERVTVIGRRALGRAHPKLTEHVRADVADLSGLEAELAEVDACLFCLGVTAAGLDEQRYTALTHDLTLSVARTLVGLNPEMAFVYVSGQGTDATEQGRAMWARVKGRTENALLALPFRTAVMFRPGVIQPVEGARSSTRWYRVLYAAMAPLMPLLRRLFPRQIVTSAELGRAMLAAVRGEQARAVLETPDIARLARGAPAV
ncbi:MAG TPA: NAD-dependent epimerase/dehydratase family protein [Longimicrobium sp.]|nr:NAD-dependent epimerase/dehydratase family protein [Longimicrobium sp.]